MKTQQEEAATQGPDGRTSALVGAMLGFGIMAAIDEIVFHQILNWHHFYDRSTTDVALVSDGLLHAGELIVIVVGFLYFADRKQRGRLDDGLAWAGLFVGLGLFQLFDGVVDHKILRVHDIRQGVDLLPYDIAWNAFGVLLVLIGLAALVRRRNRLS